MSSVDVCAEPSASRATPHCSGPSRLNLRALLLWMAVASGCFHLAHEFAPAAPLIAGFLYAMLRLATAARRAMLVGWCVGLLVYGPQLGFFWTIFGPAAIALWLVLATWLGVYLNLQRFAFLTFKRSWAFVAAPLLWTGVEYFRSELYYLRFSWLNAGYALAPFPRWGALHLLGMYGAGFLLMSLAAGFEWWRGHRGFLGKRFPLVAAMSIVVLLVAAVVRFGQPTQVQPLKIAGVQLEFETEEEIRRALDALHRAHGDADLFVLSEYTFDGPVPSWVHQWCARNRRYLVLGAKRHPGGDEAPFHNTAFVIGPDGRIVFEQGKMVPIQFFNDGLPAREQKVWESPWGRLGICVCYDLSYTRVTDELVRLGAQAIIVPTMDLVDWGERQHRLHARVAPVRAAEYGLPIFRLCSSGISQAVTANGVVAATAPYPGPGAMMFATLDLPPRGRRPLDRWLAWPCVGFAVIVAAWPLVFAIRRRKSTA